MVGRNERKLQILEYLVEVDEATAQYIAEVCDITIHNARTLFARYHQYGLLSRYTSDRYGTRVYSITTRGIDRLDWLRGDESTFDENEVDDGAPAYDPDVEAAWEDFDANSDLVMNRNVSWRHPSLAELREQVRREEARVRELEAEVHGMKTGDWSDFLRLRLRVSHNKWSDDL
ncbi:MAG: hypothetical protein NWE83_09575 [Candidatus Bathyarchaeota archaeon]|jgi:hypothetical protein|nr:hypothetical protein [Candidatus Bathyarchaeota archaeon]